MKAGKISGGRKWAKAALEVSRGRRRQKKGKPMRPPNASSYVVKTLGGEGQKGFIKSWFAGKDGP